MNGVYIIYYIYFKFIFFCVGFEVKIFVIIGIVWIWVLSVFFGWWRGVNGGVIVGYVLVYVYDLVVIWCVVWMVCDKFR